MSPSPLTCVPVFIGLALHIAGFAAPPSSQAQCRADATLDARAAWPAAQVVRVDLDRSDARHRFDAPRAAAVPCKGEGRPTRCPPQAQDTLALPTPIDPPALESRLAVFAARPDTLTPATSARAASRGYGARLAETWGVRVLP